MEAKEFTNDHFPEWDRRLDEVRRREKFDPEGGKQAQQELLRIKNEILAEYHGAHRAERSWRIARNVSIAVIVLGVLLVAYVTPVMSLLGIVGTVISVKMNRSKWDYIEQLDKYDKNRFDGEIMFKLRNGIR